MFIPKRIPERIEILKKKEAELYIKHVIEHQSIKSKHQNLNILNSVSDIEIIFLNIVKELRILERNIGQFMTLFIDNYGNALIDYNTRKQEVYVQQYIWYKFRNILKTDYKVKNFIIEMFQKYYNLSIEQVYYTNFKM